MKAPHKYKRRLRKKLHLGEFQELAFVLSADLANAADAADTAKMDALLDRFLSDAIEANQLSMAGGLNDGQLWAFVTVDARYGSITEAQREAVQAWLQADAAFTNIEVGPLRDAWYGWTGND